MIGNDPNGNDTPDERRACVECKWCAWPSAATGDSSMVHVLASCGHPNMCDQRSMITGELGVAPCITVRVYGGCGETGQWWQELTGEAGA